MAILASIRPRKARRTARLAAMVLAVVALAGAAVVRALRQPRNGTARGLTVRSVSYVDRVDLSATTAVAGGGRALRTSSGVDVRVERMLLVQRSASLVDCLGVGGDVWDARTGALGALLAVERTAYAGHRQTLDPSALVAPKVLDLLADADLEVGTTVFPEERFCRVHFVFVGALDASSGAELARESLYVRGAFRPPLGDAWTAFEWRTTQADALLLDLPPLIDGDLGGSSAQVTVERSAATYFDGVDFARADPDSNRRNAATVLANVNHRAHVHVHTR